MSRSTNPFQAPVKPAEITLDTLDQLFAHHRAVFGGWSMTAGPPEPTPPNPTPPAPAPTGPQRPEGVSEEEWTALGDPGRVALTREREARTKAERDLAAARARPTPPPNPTPPAPAPTPAPGGDGTPDLESIVQRAVQAAVKPFQDREAQRDAAVAVKGIQDAVALAAKDKFHDTSDAIVGIDLTKVTDGNGAADPAKIATELDSLLKAKPHLGKVQDGRLYAQPGFGASDSSAPLETRVQGILAQMQKTAGINPPPTAP